MVGREVPGEGIDVALAVDFVLTAVRREYDAGILVSLNTDLKPALEAVVSQTKSRAEVAASSRPPMHSRCLGIQPRRIWCHWISDHDYFKVHDSQDYTIH